MCFLVVKDIPTNEPYLPYYIFDTFPLFSIFRVCGINAEGMQDLAKCLKQNTSLTQLDLSGTSKWSGFLFVMVFSREGAVLTLFVRVQGIVLGPPERRLWPSAWNRKQPLRRWIFLVRQNDYKNFFEFSRGFCAETTRKWRKNFVGWSGFCFYGIQ